MVKYTRLRITIRVILIGLAMVLVVFVINQKQLYVASILSVLLVLGLLFELWHFLDRVNRDINSFLINIIHKDLTIGYNTGKTRKDNLLYGTFNKVLDEIRNARIDKEAHYQFLQTILSLVKTALISFDKDGKIILKNPSAEQFLPHPSSSRIKAMEEVNPGLYAVIMQLKPGENELLRTKIGDEPVRLSVYATEFRMKGISYKLVVLQNITNEMEVQELDAYHKLIRVLTHEIMNSVTPISSLSSAMNDMLRDIKGNRRDTGDLDDEEKDDLYNSLHAIEERSKGLIRFVGTYKNLTRVPVPRFTRIRLKDIFAEIKTLMGPDMEEAGIQLSFHVYDEDLMIKADHEMLGRILINLIKNAAEAIVENDKKGKIDVFAEKSGNRVNVRIRDNGPGIPAEEADKLFVPFYTTKKSGSGIGLSLCRQMMKSNKGHISFRSEKGKGTEFILEF